MKMELEIEKDDCKININGTEYSGVLQANVQIDYTEPEITPEWAECFLIIYKLDLSTLDELDTQQTEVEIVLKFVGLEWLGKLFGDITKEHLNEAEVL